MTSIGSVVVFTLVTPERSHLWIFHLQTNRKPLYFLKCHLIELPSDRIYKLKKKPVSKITALVPGASRAMGVSTDMAKLKNHTMCNESQNGTEMTLRNPVHRNISASRVWTLNIPEEHVLCQETQEGPEHQGHEYIC